MIFRIKSVIYFLLICAVTTVIIQSCKENAPVQTNPNNNNGPSVPVLVYPSNQTSVPDLTPTLQWQAYTNAVSYRLQVSLDANFSGITLIDSSGITGTQFTIASNILSANTYFYWRVMASIPAGTSGWSLIWRFNVFFNAPAAPVLTSPPDNSSGVSFLPLFDWNDVPLAQYYRFQVSQSSSFSTIAFDTGSITISQLQCPLFILNTNTQYFWRVYASDNNGVTTGPWSAVWNFTTVPGPQPNSISGRITFADTNFLSPPRFYFATVYSPSFWPPNGQPVAFDTLHIHKEGKVYVSDYKLKRLYNGSYYVCAQPNDILSLVSHQVLGIYGCDTAHVQYSTCPFNPVQVTITNNNGIENINFISWADTTNRIF